VTRWLVALVVGACKTDAPVDVALEVPVPEPTTPEAHGEHAGGDRLAHHHGADHFVDPERFVASWNDPGRDAWQKPDEIVAALGVAPGATVVDLGVGTGYLVPSLSEAVGPAGRVLAADVEPSMLAFIEAATAREGWNNVQTHPTTFTSPELAAASVDAVVTLNVWHHVEDRGVYASKARDALKPGGSFVIVDFLKEETEGFGPPVEMRLTAEQVVAELVAGGLVAEILPETMPRHYVVRGRRPVEE
jgi:predicted methyltransferase